MAKIKIEIVGDAVELQTVREALEGKLSNLQQKGVADVYLRVVESVEGLTPQGFPPQGYVRKTQWEHRPQRKNHQSSCHVEGRSFVVETESLEPVETYEERSRIRKQRMRQKNVAKNQ